MDHKTDGSDARSAQNLRGQQSRGQRVRMLGPWLVMAVLMAVLVNPQAASAQDEGNPGGETSHCFDAFDAAGFQNVQDCCRRVARFQNSDCCFVGTAFAVLQTECERKLVEPSVTPVPPTPTPVPPTPAPVVDDSGAEAIEEPTPTPTVVASARVPLTPPPPPLRGPTWMGPIKPIPGAQVTLQVPPLLAIFLARNEVTVTNADGDIVFKGIVPPNRELLLSTPRAGGAGDYTVVGMLIRGSHYTEVVPVGDPVS